MKIVAIIEARMSSSRFPGKVLAEWDKMPMIEIMHSRLKRSMLLDDIIVATTTNHADDEFVNVMAKKGIKFIRGSEENVLERVLCAAIAFQADVIVELTGDCPLIDPIVVDRSIGHFLKMGADYVGNTCITNKYPRGCDVKVFTTETLCRVEQLTDDKDDQEHVSLFIYRHPELFKLAPLPEPAFFIDPRTRLTIDYPVDYDLVKAVFAYAGRHASLEQICGFLNSTPWAMEINAGVDASYINDVDRNACKVDHE